MNLNSKFDKMNEQVTNKISTIEENYSKLNGKIESIAKQKYTVYTTSQIKTSDEWKGLREDDGATGLQYRY